MITYVETRAREEWAENLPPWKDGNSFRFEPHSGLTVLFGPNGSGKSTILRGIAQYTFTKAAKQRYYRPLDLPLTPKDEDGKTVYGDEKRNAFHRVRPPGLFIEAGWPGSRVIHLDPQQLDQEQDMDSILEQPGGLKAWCIRRTCSGGENAVSMLGQHLQIPSAPVMKAVKLPEYNETWLSCVRYFNSFAPDPDDGVERRVTVLLDEADRSASIAWQIRIWKQIREVVNAGVQVIAVSHSLAALEVADRVVEMEPGYLAETMALVERLSAVAPPVHP